MGILQVSVTIQDLKKFGLDKSQISFEELLDKISTELARQALFACQDIAERVGLSRTPHVELVMAAFRWVADPTDRLALAELARFLADDPESDAWLIAAGARATRCSASASAGSLEKKLVCT